MSIRDELHKSGHFTYDRARDQWKKPVHENKRAAASCLSDRETVRYHAQGAVRWEAGESSVLFEPTLCSPFDLPLNGQVYNPLEHSGPSGLCPICNNTRHAEYDYIIISNISRPQNWKDKVPFPRSIIERHLALHILPIYTRVGESVVSIIPGKSAASDTSNENMLRMMRGVIRDAIAAKRNSIEDDEFLKEDRIRVGAADEVAGTRLDFTSSPGIIKPSLRGAPAGSRAGSWYAYNGEKCVGSMRLWGDKRMEHEIEKRTTEAIIFYDEMIESRAMAHRIYDEIMNSDIEALNEELELRAKPGTKPKYVERNYGAAIQAVKLKKDIATDMARLALIAQKYGDEQAKEGRAVSPAVRAILDDLGLSGSRVPDARITDDADAVFPAQEDDEL